MDYAVLVGINNYPYPNQLQGCIDDMLDIKTEIEAALNFKKNKAKSYMFMFIKMVKRY